MKSGKVHASSRPPMVLLLLPKQRQKEIFFLKETLVRGPRIIVGTYMEGEKNSLERAQSRNNHERGDRPDGHQPASQALDPRDPRPGRRPGLPRPGRAARPDPG